MKYELYKPTEVDEILRYPFGKSERLARRGKLPHILLPSGDIRFRKADIENLVRVKKCGGGREKSI